MRTIHDLTSCRHLTDAPARSYQTAPSQVTQLLQQAAKNRAGGTRTDGTTGQTPGNISVGRPTTTSAASQRTGDSASISAAGRRALKEKLSALEHAGQTTQIQTLPSLHAGAIGVQNDFEKLLSELGGGAMGDFMTGDYSQEDVNALKAAFGETKGKKNDTFDTYVNQMASAYQLMKERIEQKYAAEDRQKEFYSAEDGTMQELTREKELEMLERAYTNHSTFMAASTEIWNQLQDFQVQIVPQHTSNNASQAKPAPAASADKREKGTIRTKAFEAFMSAIGHDNLRLLSRTPQGQNSLKLNLNISQEERKALNQIWDYYAGRK